MEQCYICYSPDIDDEFICDRCDNHYCDECTYTYTLHYQYQGSRCYLCSGQSRIKKLTTDIIRENKLKSILK